MITAAAFVVAAAAGAVCRFVVGHTLNRPRRVAYGTFVVNVSGSFALAVLHGVSGPAATVIGTGAIGAYTTFSSFARDAVALIEAGRSGAAAAYVVATCVACVAAAWAGLVL